MKELDNFIENPQDGNNKEYLIRYYKNQATREELIHDITIMIEKSHYIAKAYEQKTDDFEKQLIKILLNRQEIVIANSKKRLEQHKESLLKAKRLLENLEWGDNYPDLDIVNDYDDLKDVNRIIDEFKGDQ